MNQSNIKKIIFNEIYNTKNLGLNLFRLGIFLLPTAFVFSALLILSSSIIGLSYKKTTFLKDKWNYPLIISITLILISSFIKVFSFNPFINIGGWNNSFIFLDLANWLPHFFIFWAIGDYLYTSKLRKECILIFLAGSAPVILGCFYQIFLNIIGASENFYGPFTFLNGLITWYLRPIQQNDGITSIFNNANYLSSWLILIWPFSIAIFLKESNNKSKKFLNLALMVAIALVIFLTRSRSAWGLILISIPTLIGYSSFLWLIPIIFFLLIIFLILNLSSNEEVNLILENIIPKQFLMEFSNDEFINNPNRELRIDIWKQAIEYIRLSPLIGLGAGLFPVIYFLNNNNKYRLGHTHNLFLELAFNYGIPLSIIILSFIVVLLYKSYIKINSQLDLINQRFLIYNKAWWTSTFLLLISQLVDIQYYDGKISLAIWILFSGLRQMIKEDD